MQHPETCPVQLLPSKIGYCSDPLSQTEVKCLARGHLNRLLDSYRVQLSLCYQKIYSRMLSVVSCTVSVLRRLSANIKAPASTVSRSRVAECSCSLVGSSLHAVWARGCSKLFTVSTMAWGSSRNTEVTWRKLKLTLSSLWSLMLMQELMQIVVQMT